MSTYKVIQDIEAEDKLLGPLTMRQFVYAGIVLVLGFICFKLAVTKWFLAIPFLPPIIFFATLAAPFGHDQSNEVWLLAKIRFFLKPRRRIWDQSGLRELVTITVPKKIERHLTNGLEQDEVKSRLAALAHTIDSRGWAIKNVNVNLFAQPSYVMNQGSDRLVDPTTFPQEVPDYTNEGMEDILDERRNPTAQHLDQMITASADAYRQKLEQSMKQGSPQQTSTSQPAAGGWFMNTANDSINTNEVSVEVVDKPLALAPMPPIAEQPLDSRENDNITSVDEQALLEQVHTRKNAHDPSYDHMRTLKPMGNTPEAQQATPTPKATTPTPVDPVIMELAHNDDQNIATLGRRANKEVVIKLR